MITTMATSILKTSNTGRIFRLLYHPASKWETKRRFSNTVRQTSQQTYKRCFGILTSCCLGYGAWVYYNNAGIVQAKKKEKDEEFSEGLKLTSRERHFINFASAEFDGQIYMTPQDFLESFVEEEPRPRLKRRQISVKEIDDLSNATPPLRKGSSQLFRSLRDKGIISYTEYLFLLSILTKPETGFLIAFNMFDTDGNQRVDKEEFLVILHLLSGQARDRAAISEDMKQALMKLSLNVNQSRTNLPKTEDEASSWSFVKISKNVRKPVEAQKKYQSGSIFQTKYYETCDLQNPRIKSKNKILRYKRKIKKLEQNGKIMEKIFSHAWADKHGNDLNDRSNSNVISVAGDGLQRKNLVDTTLLIHFFGRKGNNTLKYDDFRRFMENLQTEVLEMEFQEFAKGAPTISEIDFARILLRYTHLDSKVCNMYLDRLLNRLKEEDGISPGITFPEFKIFCQFLNNLEDFTIAMRMYTLADHPISKGEFHRAVKICTGANLSQHLVHTVFAIFDEDGDGQLSYREFIAIMKDRLHRGFKSHIKGEGWEGFKTCIKQEIKSPVAK